MEEQLTDYKMRVEEQVRSVNELTIAKNKLSSQSSENAQRLEEAENKVFQLVLCKTRTKLLVNARPVSAFFCPKILL